MYHYLNFIIFYTNQVFSNIKFWICQYSFIIKMFLWKHRTRKTLNVERWSGPSRPYCLFREVEGALGESGIVDKSGHWVYFLRCDNKVNLPQKHSEKTIWKPLADKTSNRLAKYMEVPNTAQNLAVSALSRHCAAVMLSKFSTGSNLYYLYKLLTKKLMLQGYNESRLKSSFRKFYGRYNGLVCDYKLSLAHMLNDLLECHFHTSFDDG
jgi:hypothetical protein